MPIKSKKSDPKVPSLATDKLVGAAGAPAPKPEAVEKPWFHNQIGLNDSLEKALTLTAHWDGKWITVPWIALTKVYALPAVISMRFDGIEILLDTAKAKKFPVGDLMRAIQFQTLLEVFDQPARGLRLSVLQHVRGPDGETVEDL